MEMLENQQGQRGASFTMRFIEPGLVCYEQIGFVLVQKPALDEMMSSFVGCPIFDKRHKDTTATDFTQGRADGIVTRVWYDATDGWYWLEGLIWDKETAEDMRLKAYSVSCAYDVVEWSDKPGKHHNIPYENEVLRGKYTHLAVVLNPRYEGARILANQGGHMKLKWFTKSTEKPEETVASEAELVNSVVEIGPGKEAKLEDVLAGYKAHEDEQKRLANAKPKFADDDLIDVGDGRKVAWKDIRAGYETHLKNSLANSMETEHKDGKHKEKTMESCGLCSVELKNAADKAEADKKALELKNAAEAAKKEQERLEALRNAQAKGQTPALPAPPSDQESRLATGKERYGEIKN